MLRVRRERHEIVSATARTAHGFTQLVRGAQVEDERSLVSEDLEAERARHLKQNNTCESKNMD